MFRVALLPEVPLKISCTTNKLRVSQFAQPNIPSLRLLFKSKDFHNFKAFLIPSATAQQVSSTSPSMTEWFQKTISLPNHARGCHVVTRQILQNLPEISEFEVGLASFFVQHTSCSLTINENASPDVPLDLNDYLDKVAPEGRHYRYRIQGSQMGFCSRSSRLVSSVQSSLMGVSLTVPVQQGRLALGTWQGIYLNEHRDYGGTRKIVVTVQGKKRDDGRKFSSYH